MAKLRRALRKIEQRRLTTSVDVDRKRNPSNIVSDSEGFLTATCRDNIFGSGEMTTFRQTSGLKIDRTHESFWAQTLLKQALKLYEHNWARENYVLKFFSFSKNCLECDGPGYEKKKISRSGK